MATYHVSVIIEIPDENDDEENDEAAEHEPEASVCAEKAASH